MRMLRASGVADRQLRKTKKRTDEQYATLLKMDPDLKN
jgi:hypothetical protein